MGVLFDKSLKPIYLIDICSSMEMNLAAYGSNPQFAIFRPYKLRYPWSLAIFGTGMGEPASNTENFLRIYFFPIKIPFAPAGCGGQSSSISSAWRP